MAPESVKPSLAHLGRPAGTAGPVLRASTVWVVSLGHILFVHTIQYVHSALVWMSSASVVLSCPHFPSLVCKGQTKRSFRFCLQSTGDILCRHIDLPHEIHSWESPNEPMSYTENNNHNSQTIILALVYQVVIKKWLYFLDIILNSRMPNREWGFRN